MTSSNDRADAAYQQAHDSLLSYASDHDLKNGVATIAQYRTAYESVRTELLDAYPDIEGPTLGDLLGEAAGDAWPSVTHEL